MPVKKILIADDHAMTRKGIDLLLKTAYPKVEIVEASNGSEVIMLNKVHKPDVLLLDYNMPEMNGYDAAQILLKADKSEKIILLTMFDTKPVAFNFFKIGGKGFISKGSRIDDIIEGVRVVANGDYYFSSENEKDIGEWLEKGISQSVPTIKFTSMEFRLIVKISKGKTSKEIGEELNLTHRTVETYRYDLLRKVGVQNSMELIEYFFRNGIGYQFCTSGQEQML